MASHDQSKINYPDKIPVRAGGLATLRWDSVPGTDSYVVVRDGVELAGPLRLEGSRKEWTDRVGP